MADIKRYPLVRHFRGTPTGHVVHLSGGEVRHDGAGLSFWFRPLSAVLSEVPIDDRELPLLFHARTQDFRDVTVQATITNRFTDPALVSQRLDFGVDPDSGSWRAAPLDQVAHLLTELAASHAIDVLAGMGLTQALVGGIGVVRDSMSTGLATDARLASTGITVLAARVVAIRPEADMERALQTPTREQVQADADKATYARRAIAVERERAIAENELASRIELATREEQLVTQEGSNQRRRAEEDAAAAAVAAQAAAERTTLLATASGQEIRTLGAAQAEAETARMAACAGVDRVVLTYLALRELAGQLPHINSLTITPDLLTGALAGLMAGQGGEGRVREGRSGRRGRSRSGRRGRSRSGRSRHAMTLAPRVVIVHRRTELDELLDRHGTRGQAESFLRSRGRTLDSAQAEHDQVADALRIVSSTIPASWRRGGVERGELHRFLFDHGDIVVVVGRDGLVANVAKYLHDQPVIGIDPQPGINPGVLVRHRPDAAARLMAAASVGQATLERRTMVQATLDDGQTLIALNEIFVGHTSHQSARYRLTPPNADSPEHQSSSGLIVATGTGATGWCASIAAERGSQFRPPMPSESALAWFVREAWPSPATGTTRTAVWEVDRRRLPQRCVGDQELRVHTGGRHGIGRRVPAQPRSVTG